ncbi:MAG: dihydroneopterin aldolase [Halocynthiibacter sp.]
MTNDIRLAFAHPSERSEATPPSTPHDRISLRDHIVETEIGAFQAERGHTQRIEFNVVVEVRPISGPVDDDVDRILSYDSITEAIATELAEQRLNLLETLAERVAERILQSPQTIRVFIRIEKLDRGPGALGVEIVRNRTQAPLRPIDPPEPNETAHPVVVFLSNEAIDAPHLTRWLDELEKQGEPVILCVGAASAAAPQSGAAATQRRIDLLAIEQNAWVLAGRDQRCVVVETRTELDWAMKNGQISVWAPSKLVLDAHDGPPDGLCDGQALALWFAELVESREIIVVDDTVAAPATAHQRLVSTNATTLL